MPPETLWTRLRKARLVQVLLIYLGASWLVLQIGDTLKDALALPDWVLPTAFFLLLVGLVVVLATAWVQSHPLAEERAAAEEVPHAWELDPRDLRGALRERRLPHLTWARAVVGGASVFVLLIVAVAAVVVLKRDGGLSSATPASAAALPGLAVLPFSVSGEGSDVWREGMVDLLSTNLDGAAGLRTIDSRNVLARWRERFGDGVADAQQALEAARATGARYALLGSAVSLGDRVRLAADLYDLETGEKLGAAARVEGPSDSLFALIDEFSVHIVREALREESLTGGRELRGIERLTTSSLPALLSFLEGEAAFRRAEFGIAIDAYEAAVAADSTFALPSYRLSHAYGWSENIMAASTAEAADRAIRHLDRLSPRDAELVRLVHATLRLGIADSIAPLRALAEQYPDDPEIWHELGEAIAHTGPSALMQSSQSVPAFLRTIALDSSFAPAYIHPIELAVQRGDLAEARRLLAAFDRFGDEARDRRLTRLVDFMEGSTPPTLLDTLSTASLRQLLISAVLTVPDRADEVARLGEAFAARTEVPEQQRTLGLITGGFGNLMAGRPRRALRLLESGPPDIGFVIRYFAATELGAGDPAELARAADVVPGDAPFEVKLYLGAHAAVEGKRDRLDAVVASLRERARDARARDGAPSERDLLDAQAFEAGADALVAFARWRSGGDARTALSVFERARRSIHGVSIPMGQAAALVRRWEAEALSALGRHREAAVVYGSIPWSATSLYDSARAWEAAGEDGRARIAWARVNSMWRNAEADFALLGEASAGLERTARDR